MACGLCALWVRHIAYMSGFLGLRQAESSADFSHALLCFTSYFLHGNSSALYSLDPTLNHMLSLLDILLSEALIPLLLTGAEVSGG